MTEQMFCPPRVKEEMMNPTYWLERTKDVNKIVCPPDRVKENNRQTFQQMKVLNWENDFYQLEHFPGELSKNELLSLMKEYPLPERFPEKEGYSQGGVRFTAEIKKKILAELNLDLIPEIINVKFGLLVRRVDVRAFPTELLYARRMETVDVDLFQLTTLPAGTPVAVLHTSKDVKWVYVQSQLYRGWVQADSVAFAPDRKEVFSYYNSASYLIVTGSRIETETDPFNPQVANVHFQMGDRIPLAEPEEVLAFIPNKNLQAQAPAGCYVVKIPVRDSEGRLSIGLALIAGSNDVRLSYLPYTRENLIKQAFKMLGERYGWGGMFKRRDCSRFIMDIYRTVGLLLPRDADKQEKGAAGEKLVFNGNILEREKTLDQLEAGDPIYMDGHVVMYLGKVGANYYLIHAGAGYGREENGKIKSQSIHGVFVMEAHQHLMGQKKKYIEAFTTALKFC